MNLLRKKSLIYSRIAGIGRYLPKRVLTNENLEKIVDTTNEWIVERTGIESRHIISKGETNLLLATNASKDVLERTGIDKENIDMIVVATSTPDSLFPCTACQLQNALGISNKKCFSFDVGAACSGFMYSIHIADQFIRNNSVSNVLVLGSEVLTRVTDYTDRSMCILFGDGSGAVILQASNEQGIISSILHSDGGQLDMLCLSKNIYGEEKFYMLMKGRETFKMAVERLCSVIQEILEENSISIEDIDWFVPHQANARIVEAVAKRMNMQSDKTISSIKHCGNTSAASIPISFYEGIVDGRIKRGDLILMYAFGAGFSWGASILKY